MTFAQLRRENATNHSPNAIRAFFQDINGNPRRFQGTARYVSNRAMITIPELQVDAPLRIASTGALGVIHVYIGFSFNGLVAVIEAPEVEDIALHYLWLGSRNELTLDCPVLSPSASGPITDVSPDISRRQQRPT